MTELIDKFKKFRIEVFINKTGFVLVRDRELIGYYNYYTDSIQIPKVVSYKLVIELVNTFKVKINK